MEWITGVKLTSLQPAEIRSLVGIGQESFLTQLLEIGYLHGDPHPGNLLKVQQQQWSAPGTFCSQQYQFSTPARGSIKVLLLQLWEVRLHQPWSLHPSCRSQ